jgi:soluble lytic murein transglycosylase
MRMLKRHRPYLKRAALGCVIALSLFLVQPSYEVSAKDAVPVPALKPIFSVSESREDAASSADQSAVALPTRKPGFLSQDAVPSSGDMSSDDAQRYESIFDLQRQGQMKKADAVIKRLRYEGLMGNVLYQRYMHPTAYRSSFAELESWLDQYADYPGSRNIYKMAQQRKPSGYKGTLRKPVSQSAIARVREPTMMYAKTYITDKVRSEADTKIVRSLSRTVYRDISKYGAEDSYARLVSSEHFKALDRAEVDILLGEISAGYYYEGALQEAYNLASQSVKRSGSVVPKAAWIAGLSSWRQENYKDAAKFFEMTATSPYASGWSQAAGSYWAARSHMRSGQVKKVTSWLVRAADHPRTFYGLIATRALGKNFDFNWNIPAFSKADYKTILKYPAGRRAFDLVNAGQFHLAQKELIYLAGRNNTTLRKALLSYADHAGLPALSMRLASAFGKVDDVESLAQAGMYYDGGLYPEGPWTIKKNGIVNQSLIHAIIRQESRFDPSAQNPSGASGLMQIMPRTASYVSGDDSLSSKAGRVKLLDPDYNLALGVKYLNQLLGLGSVDGDLFHLLIAYNAGPGNLSRWKKSLPDIYDPLLFVESIPVSETRAYVERVLSNYWIYRLREDGVTPTLDAVAEGRVPDYNDAYKLADKD